MSHLRVSAEELVGWRFLFLRAWLTMPDRRTINVQLGTALWGFLGL